MSIPIPSKQALRHLASLCNASRPPVRYTRAYSLCSARKTPATSHQPHSRETSRQPSHPYTPTRSFSSITPHHNTAATRTPLPNITNHYTLFPLTLPSGPPPRGPFHITLPSLRHEFLSLQSSHHPDKYPTEPAHSKALALSALINTSYRTLSDPLLRAQYLLLTTYSIDVMSEDNSSHPTDQTTLMEVMDAQEAIEEAGSQAEIEALMEVNKARIEDTTAKMAEAFERDDSEAAKNECVRLKYWRSLHDGLKDWEPGKEVRLIH